MQYYLLKIQSQTFSISSMLQLTTDNKLAGLALQLGAIGFLGMGRGGASVLKMISRGI